MNNEYFSLNKKEKELYNRNKTRIYRYNNFPEKYPHLKYVKLDTKDEDILSLKKYKNIIKNNILIDKLNKNNILNMKKENKIKIRKIRYQEKIKDKQRLQDIKKAKKLIKEDIKQRKLYLEELNFNKKLEEQKFVCIICKKTNKSNRKLVVDHNHSCCKTGNGCDLCRRDLLCYSCNSALGLVNENITTLQSMIDYIKKHNIKIFK